MLLDVDVPRTVQESPSMIVNFQFGLVGFNVAFVVALMSRAATVTGMLSLTVLLADEM